MAIKIASNLLPGINGFLDARQGIADKIEDLKYWPFDKYPIPAGFEVFVQGDWYTYHPELENDETGSFIKRKGGLSKVLDLEKLRELIGEVGDLVYVASEEEYYQFTSDNKWEKLKLGGATGGIPIYTKKILNSLDREDIPEEYLMIPSESDLEGGLEEGETTITIPNGSSNYLDIIFKTLRTLQMEVAKMRNAFKYGMVSYTGTQTAMAGALDEMGSTTPDEEPLWAIDPDGLSIISGGCIELTDKHGLEPISNVDVYDGYLKIKGTAYWSDLEDIVKDNKDSKLFYYITSSSLNFQILLNDMDEVPEEGESLQNNYNLSIAGLDCGLSKYEIMIIISRKFPEVEFDESGEKIPETEEILYGENYIYVTLINPRTNYTVAEGYWNPGTERLSQTMVKLDKRYCPRKITFNDLTLYKTDLYSKYQEFSQEVIPSKPDDEEYKYKVAHLTIRAISNKEDLENIKDQLLENELIYEESEKILYIKNGYKLVSIGAQSSGGGNIEDSGMQQEEIIELLKSWGIVYDGASGLELSNLSDITFIHEGTGKAFKVSVDSEGDLMSTEVALGENSLESRVEKVMKKAFPDKTVDPDNISEIRGFVALLHATEKDIKDNNDTLSYKRASDLKLNSDRVKISSMYCPWKNESVFGCSHSYVELENTSDKDFPLDGCWIHWLYTSRIETSTGADGKKTESYITDVKHLALSGKIPAGSTFLIRGKQHSDSANCQNTFINVSAFDQEWFVDGKPMDFSQIVNEEGKATGPHGFILTYGKPELTQSTQVVSDNTTEGKDKSPYLYKWYYIDSFLLNNLIADKPWGPNKVNSSKNSIIRNICALDPAKQAYNGLTTADSSRARNDKPGTDQQVLNLDKEFISFPFSDEKYPISKYTPKASSQKRNVSTDKSKLNTEKPNMVFCSFGIDAHKTRCFNWISCGLYDEYVFLKGPGQENYKAFQSYKTISSVVTHDSGESYPIRKEFSVETNNAVYARINGNFPGDGSFFTSHKCIIDVLESSLSSGDKQTWTYVVGRKNSDGTPDLEHCCDERTFTIYPNTKIPKIFHTTDQQGFHWIEYQMWAAAAKKLNEFIPDNFTEAEFPVLINTGDMTQNGTRINEWLDYYNGGECLFRHLEHMAVVGNNDLVNTDPTILGTGDDNGKSNSYFFHLFNCYEVNEEVTGYFDEGNSIPKKEYLPLVKGYDGVVRYIPSLYYFNAGNYRFVMCNSEITYINCKDWFKLGNGTRAYNIYTGWYVPSSGTDSSTVNHLNDLDDWKNSFISVYEMMRKMMNSTTNEKIVACHEMPFTVITLECIASTTAQYSRSTNPSGSSLVGCHMNQITPLDNKSLNWFSRLCEEQKIKVVLGGHKHTYSITSPVRENYFYKISGDDTWRWSAYDGPMTMPSSLKDDTSYWHVPNDFVNSARPINTNLSGIINSNIPTGAHTSKLPIVETPDSGAAASGTFKPYFPITLLSGVSTGWEDPGKDNYVVYIMNQATGYKQTSNKELPTNQQSFSCLIPQTTYDDDNKASADNNQKYPMIIVVSLINQVRNIYLIRFDGIASNYKFNQTSYGTNRINLQYATPITDSKYCSWSNDAKVIMSIN